LNEDFDVVVVGGGPAGLSSARSAALGGVSVLLVERKKEIGAQIRCGEFIPSAEQMKPLMPEAKSIWDFYESRFLKDAVSNMIKRIRLRSPKNRPYEFSFDGLVLHRDVFERNIAVEAEERGTVIRTATTVEGIKKDVQAVKIALRGRDSSDFVKARLVVCADGFPSKTAEQAGLSVKPEAEDVALCVEHRVSNAEVEEDLVELFFGRKVAPGGYAWIIPKGDGAANVGLGVRTPFVEQGRTAVDYLDDFLHTHPVSSPHFVNALLGPLIGKILCVSGLASTVVGDRVLLAGDAAGTLIPVNGSGIPTALVSGHLAGEVASKFLKGDCELAVYAAALKREVGRIVGRGRTYLTVGDFFARWDGLFERLLWIIGSKNVGVVVKCEPMLPLFR